MTADEILEQMNQNQEISGLLSLGKNQQGWEAFYAYLDKLQAGILTMMQEKILDEELVMLILKDIMTAIENRDDVLLADTLQYGLNGLLEEKIYFNEEPEECQL